ncbi:MAG: glycosyltransferase family 39 protein [Candidatus Omnitrophota bacterium]
MDIKLKGNISTWVLAIVLLIAVLLRVCPLESLTRGSIEFGEGWIMAKASQPIAQIAGEILSEEAPLKYYFLHAVLRFGRSEFLIRLPALFFDIASILALFFLGRLLFDRKTAILASFFMAVSVWHIHHSAMARTYPLYVFSAILSTYFLYRATQSRHVRDWLFWVLALAFGFYSFYASLFVVIGQVCWFFLCYPGRHDLVKRFMISLGLFTALALPMISRLPQAFERKAHFGTGRWGLQGYQIWEALRDHFGGTAGPYPWGIFVFVLSFFWLLHTRKQKPQALLLLAVVAVPICFYIFCIYFFQISVIPRYFLHLYPFFLLMAAAGIASWPRRILRFTGIFVFMLPICSYGAYQAGLIHRNSIPYDYLRHYPDLSQIASTFERDRLSLDYVVVDPWSSIFSIQYYLDRDNKTPIVTGEDLQKDGQIYALYEDSKTKLYGVAENLSLLENLAAAGRLLVIDTIGLIKANRYKGSRAISTWLKAKAYRVEKGHFKEPQPSYAAEQPADFYYILPPPRITREDETSIAVARELLAKRLTVTQSLVYPFNRKESDFHEN